MLQKKPHILLLKSEHKFHACVDLCLSAHVISEPHKHLCFSRGAEKKRVCSSLKETWLVGKTTSLNNLCTCSAFQSSTIYLTTDKQLSHLFFGAAVKLLYSTFQLCHVCKPSRCIMKLFISLSIEFLLTYYLSQTHKHPFKPELFLHDC